MPSDIAPSLAQAFLHQALAAAKNRVRAQKAALEGLDQAALAFTALAEAQDIHAKKALLYLRGRIEDTPSNQAEALQEARELFVDSLDWTIQAQAESDKAASALLTQMARTLQSHLALAGVRAGAGADAAETGTAQLFVCTICGHIHSAQDEAGEGPAADKGPGRCPVCQAVPEKFHLVAA